MTLFLPSVTSLSVVGSGTGLQAPWDRGGRAKSTARPSLHTSSPAGARSVPRPSQQDLPRSHSRVARSQASLPPSLPGASLSIQTARSHVFVKKPAALQCDRVLLWEAGSTGLGCDEVRPRSWWGSSRTRKDPACHQFGQHSPV